jgi:hypothetical protein
VIFILKLALSGSDTEGLNATFGMKIAPVFAGENKRRSIWGWSIQAKHTVHNMRLKLNRTHPSLRSQLLFIIGHDPEVHNVGGRAVGATVGDFVFEGGRVVGATVGDFVPLDFLDGDAVFFSLLPFFLSFLLLSFLLLSALNDFEPDLEASDPAFEDLEDLPPAIPSCIVEAMDKSLILISSTISA